MVRETSPSDLTGELGAFSGSLSLFLVFPKRQRGPDQQMSRFEPKQAPMPSPADRILTIDQLRALPDDGHRHELLDGVHVVTPRQDRQHQSAIRGLLKTLSRQLAGRADYEVMISPSEVILGSRTLVQPDLFVVSQDPDHPIRSWADLTVPLLVVEVLSPDTIGRDRGVKRRIYQDAGVQECWIVDLDQGHVERWMPARAEAEIACRTLHWTLPNAAAGQIDLSEYFTEVLRED